MESNMAEYYIRKWFDPILRKKCTRVHDFPGLDGLISALNSFMSKESGLGLAAPQIGDDRQVLLAKIKGSVQEFVNPEITGAKGYIPFIEGCISLPGLIVPRIRRYSIDVSYQDRTGKKKTGTFKGLSSIILQHEIDHLNGKLMYNYFK